jgi:Prenyltransferase and squalene oxidase repeat
MNTPRMTRLRRPLRAFGAVALILGATALAPAAADATVSTEQAVAAAARGAQWFEANQAESGALGSDWGMTALAATGTNAADVRAGLTDPSAQDFYLDEWQAEGPGGAGTDAERGILAGVAGGIQTSRLGVSEEVEKSNLVARIAELYDGTQIGEEGLLNDDIFGVLALHEVGAPEPLLRKEVDYLRTRQLPDGGWSWSASPTAVADTDMTGSVVAAFCAAGVTTADPDLQKALALLHSLQDEATGGFVAPPPFGIGVNTDTTAWVASGLVECGIDPQAPEWTTAAGKTPFDYLLSMQEPDGHFDWTSSYGGGAFETYDAVRPLAGVAFSTAAPQRVEADQPAVRPVTAPEAGTAVPVTLVIDHEPAAEDVRMCRVDVAEGTDLASLLAAAQATSVPAGCVSEFATGTGAGGTRIASLDGVPAGNGWDWQVRVDGGAASAESNAPIGFGDLVYLRFAAEKAGAGPAPQVSVPPLESAPQKVTAPAPRVQISGRLGRHGNRLLVTVACPRGLGEFGCRGVLSARFKSGGHPWKAAGQVAYRVGSGARQRVSVPASTGLRKALRTGLRLRLRVLAATRAEDGAVTLTRVRRTLAG